MDRRRETSATSHCLRVSDRLKCADVLRGVVGAARALLIPRGRPRPRRGDVRASAGATWTGTARGKPRRDRPRPRRRRKTPRGARRARGRERSAEARGARNTRRTAGIARTRRASGVRATTRDQTCLSLTLLRECSFTLATPGTVHFSSRRSPRWRGGRADVRRRAGALSDAEACACAHAASPSSHPRRQALAHPRLPVSVAAFVPYDATGKTAATSSWSLHHRSYPHVTTTGTAPRPRLGGTRARTRCSTRFSTPRAGNPCAEPRGHVQPRACPPVRAPLANIPSRRFLTRPSPPSALPFPPRAQSTSTACYPSGPSSPSAAPTRPSRAALDWRFENSTPTRDRTPSLAAPLVGG